MNNDDHPPTGLCGARRLGAVGCPSGRPGGRRQDRLFGGFTGPIESLVPPIHDAASLAVKHVDDQGGILDGRKLVIVQGDSTCADATAAANAADRMVNAEKVVAIVGPLCSGETIAAANSAAIPGGVVIVSPAATSPALTTTSTTRTWCSAPRPPTPIAATCWPRS